MANLKIRDIMTSQVTTLSENDSLMDAVAKISLDEISGIPIIEEGYRMTGIITENDLIDYLLKIYKKHNPKGIPLLDPNEESKKVLEEIMTEFEKTRIGDIMTRTVMTASPNSDVIEVLKVMIDKNINRLPVLEKGVLVGIVSRGDMITMIYRNRK